MNEGSNGCHPSVIREPEVGNLVDMLVGMGAKIEGKGTDRLTIHGVEKLHPADSMPLRPFSY